MISILILKKDGASRRLRMEKDEVAIGRTEENDVVLAGGNVSKHHARLAIGDGKLTLIDLKSTNGTYIDGVRLDAPREVGPSEQIVIGDYSLMVQALSSDADKRELAKKPRSAGPVEVQAVRRMRDAERQQYARLQKELHERLVEYLDLRRLDLEHLGDEELRSRTERAIRELMAQMAGNEQLSEGVDRDQLLKDVLNEALGLGSLESLLADENVTEIMVNHAEQIYVEREGKISLSDKTFSSNRAVLGVIERIVAPIGRRIDESTPWVDARLKELRSQHAAEARDAKR